MGGETISPKTGKPIKAEEVNDLCQDPTGV
jgi:hypothetical protein